MHQPAAASRRESSSTVATKVAGSLSPPPSEDGTSMRKNPPATRASATSRGSLRLRSPSPECAASRGARVRAASERASPIGWGSVADDDQDPRPDDETGARVNERVEPPVAAGCEPEGMVEPSHFELRESPVPEPADGEFLVRNLYLSLDPRCGPG